MLSRLSAFCLCTALAGAQTFEVASVKPAPAGARTTQVHGGPGSSDPGAVRLDSIDLFRLLTLAYGIESYQLVAPEWLTSARFDIAARLPPSTTVDQYRTMLQSLLAERFKLAVHRDRKDGRVFDLVVAKGGPKLKESAADSAAAGDGSLQPAFGPPTPPPGYNGPLTLLVRNCPMEQFARRLSGLIGQPVTNATGLNGAYEIHFQYSLAGLQVDAPSATIFDALQEQLGLKLTPGKGMIERLVVDHIERVATGN